MNEVESPYLSNQLLWDRWIIFVPTSPSAETDYSRVAVLKTLLPTNLRQHDVLPEIHGGKILDPLRGDLADVNGSTERWVYG